MSDDILDRVTDTIVGLVADGISSGNLDPQNLATHVRRLLRDECKELWEESAAESDRDRLQAIIEKPDSIKRLEAWKAKCKTHTYKIEVDDGFGASPCYVELRNGALTVTETEKPDYPGLAETINAALDRVEKEGLL